MDYAIDRLKGTTGATSAAHETVGFVAAFVVFLAMFLTPVLASTSVLIAIAAGAIYLLWVRGFVVAALVPALPLMALPLWALLSATWSEAPAASLRHGTQLCGTVLLALILVRTMSVRTLAAALLLAGFATALVGLILGYEEIAANRALSGGMGSKNFMAFNASLTIMAALGVGLDALQSPRVRVLALAAFATNVWVLHLCQSVGAWISTIAGAAFLGALLLSAWLPRMARGAALILALVAAPLAWIAVPQFGEELAAAGLQATGKDSTLTGRTELWARAEPVIAQRPVLGHGYRAFWRRGATDAEGLWRLMHIGSRTGFNFHSQYIDLLVELGIVGLALFALTALFGGVSLLARAIAGANLSVCFFAAALFTLLVRTPVETTIVAEFNIFSIAFFAACCIGVSRPPEEARASA